ncbi:hypothetical protein GCM10028864_31910 [Microlunatus parietis]
MVSITQTTAKIDSTTPRTAADNRRNELAQATDVSVRPKDNPKFAAFRSEVGPFQRPRGDPDPRHRGEGGGDERVHGSSFDTRIVTPRQGPARPPGRGSGLRNPAYEPTTPSSWSHPDGQPGLPRVRAWGGSPALGIR